jgi:hypothetical protein
VSLCSEFRVVILLRFPHASDVFLLYLRLFVGGLMSYLRYLCLLANSGVQHTLCCVFVLFVFVLSLVHPMLLVSSGLSILDCSSVISIVYSNTVQLHVSSKQFQNPVERC